MKKGLKKLSLFGLAFVLILCFGITSGLAKGNVIENGKVGLVKHKELGKYLVDSEGRTLYYFTKNVTDLEACVGPCLNLWTPFTAEHLDVKNGLKKGDFQQITRADGTKQWTYMGWPLYYFNQDTNPGDVKGNGFKNIWFVINHPFSIAIGTNDSIGNYLTDASGNTLYYITDETFNCTGPCEPNWPVFYSKKMVVPSGLNEADFGEIVRSDGTKQTTYKGLPLYYFIKDGKRGDTNGHGVINKWSVVNVLNP